MSKAESEKKRGIKGWPEEDRPREKLVARGADALTDAELVAIMLRTGGSGDGSTALDMARKLIDTFGGMKGLSMALLNELTSIKGIGIAKAATIKAALEMGVRTLTKSVDIGQEFTCSRDVYEHLYPRLRDANKETFIALLMDVRNRKIKEITVGEGTLDAMLIHPREVFQAAIRENASGVIFAHNHPSGDPSPSLEDVEVTKRLMDAGNILGIKVLDHVIVARDGYTSIINDQLEDSFCQAGHCVSGTSEDDIDQPQAASAVDNVPTLEVAEKTASAGTASAGISNNGPYHRDSCFRDSFRRRS